MVVKIGYYFDYGILVVFWVVCISKVDYLSLLFVDVVCSEIIVQIDVDIFIMFLV